MTDRPTDCKYSEYAFQVNSVIEYRHRTAVVLNFLGFEVDPAPPALQAVRKKPLAQEIGGHCYGLRYAPSWPPGRTHATKSSSLNRALYVATRRRRPTSAVVQSLDNQRPPRKRHV